MPRLSVCIPTYNGARYLERALKSVLRQRDVELRIVVGDDASTDDTLEVARSTGDPRVEVYAFDERQGLSGNWSRTWARRGVCDYVALVGQDDLLSGHWATTLVGLLRTHPEAALAFGRREFEFEDEESKAAVGDFFLNRYPAMIDPFYQRIGEVIEPQAMVEEAMRFRFEINLIGEPSFVVVRNDHPAVAAGFDPGLSQLIDWEFYTRLFDRPVVHSPASVGSYHIHSAGQSVENAPLSRHYREYDRLLGIVMHRFAGALGAEQMESLKIRRDEVVALRTEWEHKEEQLNDPTID